MFPRVLVVDDSELVHALLRVHFQNEQVEMHSALDGESGLQMIDRLRPDLVLLDIDMPDMGGFEVCRRLRDNPFTMNVPVIFLTAASSTGEKVCGLELGASDYITKPFEPAELLARVSAALRIKARMDFLGARRVKEFMVAPCRSQEALRR